VRKRIAIAGAAALLLLAAGAGAYALYRAHEGRNVRGSSSVEFATTAPRPVRQPRSVYWPLYGYDPARLRSPLAFTLRPPYRPVWTFGAGALLEFPPVIGYGRIVMVNNAGTVFALNEHTGAVIWTYRSRRCSAASPAIDRYRVFVVLMNKPPCNTSRSGIDGRVLAFSARFGKRLWSRAIGPSETSPLVANGTVYVGDWAGKVYAFTAASGNLRWSYTTGGKIKGGAALDGNRVFVGSYDGHVYALDARTGKRIWRASAQARLGPTGTFYATPAVAYDRVYIGSTDRKIYSFGEHTGRLRWSHGTGGYVYASPAVWHRLVLVGSYDGSFYAFDAATGDIRWRFSANGPISGSAVVIDGLVYFSTLKGKTYVLTAATGKEVWSYPAGVYAAVVADPAKLYLIGYSKLYALVPLRR
jgi:outer membrane protein assembly factor BamB